MKWAQKTNLTSSVWLSYGYHQGDVIQLGVGRVEGCEKLDGSEDRAQKLKMTLSLVSVCHSPPTLCHPSKERWLLLCARKIRLDTTVEDDAEKVNMVSRIKEMSSN